MTRTFESFSERRPQRRNAVILVIHYSVSPLPDIPDIVDKVACLVPVPRDTISLPATLSCFKTPGIPVVTVLNASLKESLAVLASADPSS